jgi:hypothetical protein
MAQHRDIVTVEQMGWIADNPLPPLMQGQRIPASELTRHAMIGLHALEHLEGTAFRWTWPALLLRLAAGRRGAVTIETRNLRPGLQPSSLVAVMANGGKTIAVARDDAGNITLRFETPVTSSGVAEIVLIAPELIEPCVAGEPGRRLGLPLFSLTIAFA